jgi:hypothetical protein
MPMTDFLIYVLGIYGLSWLITQSKLFFPIREKLCSNIMFSGRIKRLFCELITCIVCTSVWLSLFFVTLYFSQELWYTKILIVGTTTTVTWILANLLDDI